MNPRHVVITAVYGYSPRDIAPFLLSLHRFNPEATIALITKPKQETQVEAFRRLHPGAQLVPLTAYSARPFFWNRLSLQALEKFPAFRPLMTGAWRFLSRTFFPGSPRQEFMPLLHISLARYFEALHLVRHHFPDAEKILLCDSRDVLFQSDPFAWDGEGFITGLEDIRLTDCRINRSWIEYMYGHDNASSFGEFEAICSGVTLGRRGEIMTYLEEMCGEMAALMPVTSFKIGLDQGIHNWLLRKTSRLSQGQLLSNGNPYIATIGHGGRKDFDFSEKNGLLTAGGSPVSIVHQYDRHPELASWCGQLYPPTL